jgi:predicted kinase
LASVGIPHLAGLVSRGGHDFGGIGAPRARVDTGTVGSVSGQLSNRLSRLSIIEESRLVRAHRQQFVSIGRESHTVHKAGVFLNKAKEKKKKIRKEKRREREGGGVVVVKRTRMDCLYLKGGPSNQLTRKSSPPVATL